MQKFINTIGSRRFAMWLLLLTLVVVFAANLLPKPYLLTKAELEQLETAWPVTYMLGNYFNVQKVTKSLPFVFIMFFLFASISICTIKRVRQYNSSRANSKVYLAGSLPIAESIEMKNAQIGAYAMSRLLKKMGWAIENLNTDCGELVYCRKGEKGIWGSVVFHAGLCLILVGAFFSAQSRFNGKVILTDGFEVNPSMALKGLTIEERELFPVKGIVLEKFVPLYEGLFPVDYTAFLRHIDGEQIVTNSVVRVNEPLIKDEYQFLLTRYGFAPRFVLTGDGGKIVSDDVIILAVINPADKDYFKLIKGIYDVQVRLYPDFELDKSSGKPTSRSRNPINPVFEVNVSRNGQGVKSGYLSINKALSFDEYKLEFRSLSWWVQLDVSKDKGIPFIFSGFVALVAGLIARLLLNERAVWIIMYAYKIDIGGKCSYFPRLFEDELKQIVYECGAMIHEAELT